MLIKRWTDIKKRRWQRFICLSVVLPMLLPLTGCGSDEAGEDPVVMEQQEEETAYNLAIAALGDVTLTQEIKCTYEQLVEQEISFAVSGKPVTQIYVSVGDKVQKGEILAELGSGGSSDRIEELTYQIARNKQLLEYSLLNEENEILLLKLQYEYYTNQTKDDEKALEEAIERVQTRYRHEKEDYQDAIDLDTMELELLKKEVATSVVRAGINGTVKWIETNLEDSTSVKDKVIMRIVDGSECLFAIPNLVWAPLFSEGMAVDMVISSGDGKGSYKLLPYHMSEWEEQERLMFVFAEGYEANIEMGTSGTITVVMESRENVLQVPKQAVHTADGKAFVYCIGEDNMREVRWVETGLYGDKNVEILSGLAEGERVILR